jgi:hypothetical protein
VPSDNALLVEKRVVQISIRYVIGAYSSEASLEVYFLVKKKGYYTLSKVEGTVKDTAKEWSEALMDAAYHGTSSKILPCKSRSDRVAQALNLTDE